MKKADHPFGHRVVPNETPHRPGHYTHDVAELEPEPDDQADEWVAKAMNDAAELVPEFFPELDFN